MRFYGLEMGEGIAGPLSSVGAMTTTLYSCIGICMVNEGAGRGGLYHYPATSLVPRVPLVWSAIIAMINQVQPTAIYVTPAGDREAGIMARMMPRSEEEDVANVVDLLEKSVGHASTPIRVEVLPAGSFANYWRDGRLHLNEQSATQPGRDGLEGMEDYSRSGPQALGGGVYYFGINAERNRTALDPKPRRPGSPPIDRRRTI